MKSSSFMIKTVTLSVVLAVNLTVVANPRKVSLQDCIDMAFANNLALKSGRLSVDRAQVMQGTAFDVEQTSVTLSQDATGGGGPENGVSISQSFDFPTVYIARHKSLKAETELQKNNLELSRITVARDVASVYYALLHAREVVRLCQRQDSVYRKFMTVANVKFENGEAGRLEQMNAERIYNVNRLDLLKAKDDYALLAMRLKGLVNADCDIVPADSGLVLIEHVLPESDMIFDMTPAGRVYSGQVELSLRNLALAKQEFMPGLTFGATVQALIKGFNPYDVSRDRFREGNFMGFEIGITVPLFFGSQRAKTKAARIEVDRSRALMRQAAVDAENEYRDWLNRYATASENLEYYTAEATGRNEELERISRVSYELGDIGYVEYMQNLETVSDMRLRYASAVNDYNQAVIMLNYLRGI